MARAEAAEVTRFERDEFLREVWDYRPGEHVTVLAPSGGGKTYLSFQLLQHAATEHLPAVVMVMKPRDSTVQKWGQQLELHTVRDWPPPVTRKVWKEKPRGWLVWPRHTFDPAIDDARQRWVFRKAILDSYRNGHRILFADETYSLEEELELSTELRTVWTKGRSMECGLFAASQRPAYISKWAYQAHHIFLGFDGDEDTQRRFSEIGGSVNPAHVRWAVSQLGEHEFLYINREERAMCVVGP